MNILCVIPARGGSKRVSNKNIRKILSQPLIAYTIQSALQSRLCNKVIVSTDDSEIAAVAKDFGAEVITRPNELAMDNSPIDDALRHAVRHYEKKDGLHADIV